MERGARKTTLDEYGAAATHLTAAGADITVLAAAMKIFIRRAETREQALD